MFSSGYTQLDNLPIVNCSSPNVLKVGINIFLVCTVNNKFSAESLCSNGKKRTEVGRLQGWDFAHQVLKANHLFL